MLHQLWKCNVPCLTFIELFSKWYELVNFAQLTFGFNSSLLFEAEASRQGGKYVLTGGVRKLHDVGSSRTAAVTRYCYCRGCRQTVEVRLKVCVQKSHCICKQTTLDTDLRLAKRTNTANTMSRKARPSTLPCGKPSAALHAVTCIAITLADLFHTRLPASKTVIRKDQERSGNVGSETPTFSECCHQSAIFLVTRRAGQSRCSQEVGFDLYRETSCQQHSACYRS